MKKILAALVLILGFVALNSIAVMASPVPVEGFEITGGIDTTKESTTTFDATRIISGTAEKGAGVTIAVYRPAENGQNTLLNSYCLTVGSTGIFSQCVNLYEGKNYIVITASKDEKYSEFSTTINRKGKVIKAVLSQYIALPGQTK